MLLNSEKFKNSFVKESDAISRILTEESIAKLKELYNGQDPDYREENAYSQVQKLAAAFTKNGYKSITKYMRFGLVYIPENYLDDNDRDHLNGVENYHYFRDVEWVDENNEDSKHAYLKKCLERLYLTVIQEEVSEGIKLKINDIELECLDGVISKVENALESSNFYNIESFIYAQKKNFILTKIIETIPEILGHVGDALHVHYVTAIQNHCSNDFKLNISRDDYAMQHIRISNNKLEQFFNLINSGINSIEPGYIIDLLTEYFTLRIGTNYDNQIDSREFNSQVFEYMVKFMSNNNFTLQLERFIKKQANGDYEYTSDGLGCVVVDNCRDLIRNYVTLCLENEGYIILSEEEKNAIEDNLKVVENEVIEAEAAVDNNNIDQVENERLNQEGQNNRDNDQLAVGEGEEGEEIVNQGQENQIGNPGRRVDLSREELDQILTDKINQAILELDANDPLSQEIQEAIVLSILDRNYEDQVENAVVNPVEEQILNDENQNNEDNDQLAVGEEEEGEEGEEEEIVNQDQENQMRNIEEDDVSPISRIKEIREEMIEEQIDEAIASLDQNDPSFEEMKHSVILSILSQAAREDIEMDLNHQNFQNNFVAQQELIGEQVVENLLIQDNLQ